MIASMLKPIPRFIQKLESVVNAPKNDIAANTKLTINDSLKLGILLALRI